MTEPKSPRLTLHEADSSPIRDLVDRLVDAPRVRAASIIRNLSRHKVDLALLSVVASVDERWRVGRKPVPLPAGSDGAEKMRRAIAEILAEHPAAIYPALLALSDAVDEHDPRPRVDIRTAPYTPPPEIPRRVK